MLELPYINLLCKCDLVTEDQRMRLNKFLEVETDVLDSMMTGKLKKLTKRICHLINQYNLVQFHQLDITNEESVYEIASFVDSLLQYEDFADTVEDHVLFEQTKENDDDI
jgi:hypothetical protein